MSPKLWVLVILLMPSATSQIGVISGYLNTPSDAEFNPVLIIRKYFYYIILLNYVVQNLHIILLLYNSVLMIRKVLLRPKFISLYLPNHQSKRFILWSKYDNQVSPASTCQPSIDPLSLASTPPPLQPSCPLRSDLATSASPPSERPHILGTA